MKINVKEGHCVRLTGRKYSSIKGGVYDLAKVGGTERDYERLVKLPGVTPAGAAKAKAADKGGA
jgi:hypothetical protein